MGHNVADGSGLDRADGYDELVRDWGGGAHYRQLEAEVSDTQLRTLSNTFIAALLALAGGLGLLLWNNQQDVLRGMSERINHLEAQCVTGATFFMPPSLSTKG
jgi:hypothetical protein